jgi:hypothetical protein
MTRHAPSTRKLPIINPFSAAAAEEALVTDTRAGLSPAQMVERKLVTLLKRNALPAGPVPGRTGATHRGR